MKKALGIFGLVYCQGKEAYGVDEYHILLMAGGRIIYRYDILNELIDKLLKP
jgi:hypothetical protein